MTELPNGIEFEILVDWDGDNAFTVGSADDITPYVKDAVWSIGMGEPYQFMGDETALTLTLTNKDQRFSPEYTSGPYYGNLLPRRKVRIRAYYSGTWYALYLGWIDAIEVEGASGREAALHCTGAKQLMQDQEINLPLLTDVRTDEVILALLEKLSLPAAAGFDNWLLGLPGNSELGETTYLGDLSPAVDLETGALTLPYAADNWDINYFQRQFVGEDWEKPFKGYPMIEDVVKAERGRFFFDRAGKAVFWNRSHLLLLTTLDATFDNQHMDIDYRYGADIVNVVTVNAYPRSISAATDTLIWQLDDTITLAPGQQKTLTVKYGDQDSGKKVAAIAPYVDTFTATGSVTYGVVFSATSARITLTNPDPSVNTVSAILIKGQKVTTYNQVIAQSIDGTSQAAYGRREWLIDSKAQSDPALAQLIADFEVSRRKDPLGMVYSMTLKASDDTRTTQMLTRTIGDRIRVMDEQTQHDGEYFIIGERHNWALNAGYTVTWMLEPASANQYWILGVAGFSEIGETTWLGL